MHQQPPRPHLEADSPDVESSNLRASEALRFSKTGSMIGRPPVTTHTAATVVTGAAQTPARSSQATVIQETQQEGAGLSSGPSVMQGGGQKASMVRLSHAHQGPAAQPLPALQQQPDEQWSAAAHLQAVEMLLDVAQHTPSSPPIALQHVQSISLLCQSCMASLTDIQRASKAAAPLQSIQSLCQSATEASLQQPHAQRALWVSLRLLCRTISSTFDT